MTIKEAVHAYLTDVASRDGFEPGMLSGAIDYADTLVGDAVDEWCLANGYVFDDDQCTYVKENTP